MHTHAKPHAESQEIPSFALTGPSIASVTLYEDSIGGAKFLSTSPAIAEESAFAGQHFPQDEKLDTKHLAQCPETDKHRVRIIEEVTDAFSSYWTAVLDQEPEIILAHAREKVTARGGTQQDVTGELLARHRDTLADSFGPSILVKMVVEEAITNHLCHGVRVNLGKEIGIVVRGLAGGVFEMESHDQGKGFNVAALPDMTLPENLGLPHGRGVGDIIKGFSDSAFYPSENGGRKLVVHFDIARRIGEKLAGLLMPDPG